MNTLEFEKTNDISYLVTVNGDKAGELNYYNGSWYFEYDSENGLESIEYYDSLKETQEQLKGEFKDGLKDSNMLMFGEYKY